MPCAVLLMPAGAAAAGEDLPNGSHGCAADPYFPRRLSGYLVWRLASAGPPEHRFGERP